MSLPRYNEYKHSGIPWVDGIPAHWHVQPLMGVANERSESNAGMYENNLLSLSYGRIVRKDIDSNNGLLPESFETYQIVREGDIVLRLTDLQNDKRSLRSAQVQEQGIITSAYLALQPTGAASAFLSYLLRAYDLRKVFYSMGGGLRQSMKFADLKRMPIVVPPTSEQTAVAAFLDRETAKIDALITGQEKLIALLAEKRQATISHAVTKGINPDAPVKESGVAWLGEVPAHWEVCFLKSRFTSVDYGISDSLSAEGCVAVLRMGNIVDGQVSLDDLKYVDKVDPYLLLECDDLLFNRTNSLALVGKVGLFESPAQAVSFASYLVRIRLKPNNVPKYFSYLLNAPGLLGEVRSRAFEAIGQCNLNPTRYGQLRLVVPPREEQLKIAAFLEYESQKIDALKSEAERAVCLLKERRAALITAAVTGQIDVRAAVPQSATESPEPLAA